MYSKIFFIFFIYIFGFLSIGCSEEKKIKIKLINYVYNFEISEACNKEKNICRQLFEEDRKSDITLINTNTFPLHDITIELVATGQSGERFIAPNKLYIGEWLPNTDLRNKIDLNNIDFEKNIIKINSKEGRTSVMFYDKGSIEVKNSRCLVLPGKLPFQTYKCDFGYKFINRDFRNSFITITYD